MTRFTVKYAPEALWGIQHAVDPTIDKDLTE